MFLPIYFFLLTPLAAITLSLSVIIISLLISLLIDSTTNGSSYSMLEKSFKKCMDILRYDSTEYLKALKPEDNQLDLF